MYIRQRGKTIPLFLFVLASAALFVVLTSQALPDVVASHFVGSGTANSFMPRHFYIRFMLAFVVGMPLLIVIVTWFTFDKPNARLNLPHRDYWLAPQRRAATVASLRAGMVWFAMMLVLLLCYVHWLVVRANALQPPFLAPRLAIGGLVVFVAATLVWMWVVFGRYRNPP